VVALRAYDPFRKMLEGFNQDFEAYLTEQFSGRTARIHSYKVALFIDFLCWNTNVKSIDEITRGIANSHFRKWYMSKIGNCSETELKSAIKKFFQFLAEKKGIRNEKVMMSFRTR
jgi:site-specific recombinase XerD